MGIISQLREKVTEYVDVYVKLFKLDFIGRTANLLSYFIFVLIGLFIAFCILLFIGFGLTEVFAEMGLTRMAGFFLVIGIYTLLLIIMFALRTRITRFFASGIIKVMTQGDDEEKQEKE
jgi:hypothetical protein